MSTSALPPPALVADDDGLDRLVQALAPCPVVAVDTESNSLHAYRECVCLIQFSTPDADFIVDAIGLPDLSRLAPVFANPTQQKVFSCRRIRHRLPQAQPRFRVHEHLRHHERGAHTGVAEGRSGRHSRHLLRRDAEQEVSAYRLETPPPDTGTAGLCAARHALPPAVTRPAAPDADRVRALAGGTRGVRPAGAPGARRRRPGAGPGHILARHGRARSPPRTGRRPSGPLCVPRRTGRARGPASVQDHGRIHAPGARTPVPAAAPATCRVSPG